ncbi:hypothetical protein AC623_08880 [Bacillus sp. FJAT-27231]|uniref:hypothetical protein n=1 Tax=Bacillus sp. FJAT-27231 TaxID=1679168 RepID=UPI00067122FC|nr:hypothetical protein [Bacillus sp. FJAT-27231]KMY54066.1 hypothetical protein AC623_08880 [Bacillus sp. FJAT-27231]
MKPNLLQLLAVTERFERQGISYALGGSGLLYSLGLTDTIRDWDMTTDAPKELVLGVLDSLHVEEIESGVFPFASHYKLLVHQNNPQVEVIGHFSIVTEKGICNLPILPFRNWKGIQVASPEVWYTAYALMGRTAKANILWSFLNSNGANRVAIQTLLRLPLSSMM